MSGRTMILAGLLLAAGASDAFAQWGPYRGGGQGRGGGQMPVSLGARYRQWNAELDGKIEAEDAGLAGSGVGLDSTLGLDDEEKINDIAIWSPNLPFIGALNLQYWWGKFEGDSTLDSDITFGGQLFPATTAMSSELEWKVWTALWETGGGIPGLGGLGMGTGLMGQVGLKYLMADTKVDGGGMSGRAEVKAIIPVIGVRATLPLGQWFAIDGEINGARAFGVNGIDGVLYDYSVTAKIQLMGLFAGAGYRKFKIDVEDTSPSHSDEIDIDLEMDGFYFEVGFKF